MPLPLFPPNFAFHFLSTKATLCYSNLLAFHCSVVDLSGASFLEQNWFFLSQKLRKSNSFCVRIRNFMPISYLSFLGSGLVWPNHAKLSYNLQAVTLLCSCSAVSWIYTFTVIINGLYILHVLLLLFCSSIVIPETLKIQVRYVLHVKIGKKKEKVGQ